MFNLTTTRGRLAVAAVAALALTMVACEASAPDEPAVEDDPIIADTGEDDAPADDTADEETDGSGGGATEADDGEAAAAALASASAVTCHDRNDAGGNSDVVFTLALDGVDAGTTGTVTYDGPAGTAQAEFEVGADGTATVLLPAMSFGDTFTITAVAVGGADVDTAAAASSLSHTVPDGGGSDCSTHPNA